MGKKREKIQTDKNSGFFQDNPFNQLEGGISETSRGELVKPIVEERSARMERYFGRLDLKREKTGRGGKTVTVILGTEPFENESRKEILKELQAQCGVGGSIQGDCLELQGDQREKIKPILEKMGFRVVLSGG